MARELSVLISELNDADPGVRAGAARELARLGEEARGAAVGLVRAAGDENEQVLEWATAALEELGPPSAADLPALGELAAHENADVAYWAVTLIGRLAERAVGAVPALCAALDENRPLNVRERAAWALGRIGPAAGEPATAALKRAAAGSQPRLARLANRALEQIAG